MNNFEYVGKATEKQLSVLREHGIFIDGNIEKIDLDNLSKQEASKLIKEIITNIERYYTEMVEF